MRNNARPALGVFLGAALIGSLAIVAEAAEMRFDHVMNIGTQGFPQGKVLITDHGSADQSIARTWY